MGNQPTTPPPSADEQTNPNKEHDPNPLEFPAPGTLLGRITGGTPGALKVKLIPNDPNQPPIHTYYTKPIHSLARFRRHCPVIARIDPYTDDITDLQEDLIQRHWEHYPPIPGIIDSITDTGVIKLRAELEGMGIGGYDNNPITTFKNRLNTQEVPKPGTRILFWGVVTHRTKKQKGSNRMPKQERYIDVIHIALNLTPMTKNEKQVLFPPLLEHLTDKFNINIKIGTSPLTDAPDTYGETQTAYHQRNTLMDIITRTRQATDRALITENRHNDTARKLKHVFSCTPPKINLLIKPRKYLSFDIRTINQQLHENPKLRNIIDNIYLILPANPRTNSRNPYHSNPHIIPDIDNSPNNFAHHIYHIDQPTFEGAYDPTTKELKFKRAKNLRTYNLIQFKSTTTTAFSKKHTLMPSTTRLPTPSFADQTDADASDADTQTVTDHIIVSYPTENEDRRHRATQILTKLHDSNDELGISIQASSQQGWQDIKIELGLTQDTQPILDELTASNALVAAMDEDSYSKGAKHNYILIAKKDHLTNSASIATLHSLGFAIDEKNNTIEAPPPTTRIISTDAISMYTPLDYTTVTQQLNQLAKNMGNEFPYKAIYHPSQPQNLFYPGIQPKQRAPPETNQTTRRLIPDVEDIIDIVIDISPHAPKISETQERSAIKRMFRHFKIPVDSQNRATWVANPQGARGIKCNALGDSLLNAPPFKMGGRTLATISRFSAADYPFQTKKPVLSKNSPPLPAFITNKGRTPQAKLSEADSQILELANKLRQAKVNTKHDPPPQKQPEASPPGNPKDTTGKPKSNPPNKPTDPTNPSPTKKPRK